MYEDGGWSNDDGESVVDPGASLRRDAGGNQAGAAARKKGGRALSTLVHTVLFLTASVGFTISFAMLGDEQPWALDLEATEGVLGIGRGQVGSWALLDM